MGGESHGMLVDARPLEQMEKRYAGPAVWIGDRFVKPTDLRTHDQHTGQRGRDGLEGQPRAVLRATTSASTSVAPGAIADRAPLRAKVDMPWTLYCLVDNIEKLANNG